MQLSEIAFDSTKKGFKTTKLLLKAIELFEPLSVKSSIQYVNTNSLTY